MWIPTILILSLSKVKNSESCNKCDQQNRMGTLHMLLLSKQNQEIHRPKFWTINEVYVRDGAA